jgi:hypothetical protein
MTMARRTLLSLSASALATRALAQMTAAKPAVHIRVSDAALTTMPRAFSGLSYESAQLYNPRYFSAQNTTLVDTFTRLSPAGVLRLGGNLSDLARWESPAGDFATPKQAAALAHLRTTWEWVLTDPVARASRDGAITPAAIEALRGFLDATGWKAIYGLNFGSGSAARARDEATHVARILGTRLIAFQIGNEADFYAGNRLFRDKGFDFEAYLAGYRTFVAAIREAVPQARFAGPDTAVNMQWTEQYARREGRDAVFLSSHHYAMGPAGDPHMTAEHLLAPNAGLAHQIVLAQAAARDGSVPFRLTETNSCYMGGQPGVSDTFAAALWGADMMLETARAGYAGVNLHGGGSGIYTPIATDTAGTTTRPLYSGMRFAERFAGAQFLQTEVANGDGLTAYAARDGNTRMLAVINKSADAMPLSLDWEDAIHHPPRSLTVLSATSLAAKDVSLAETTPALPASVPAHTAMLLTWEVRA